MHRFQESKLNGAIKIFQGSMGSVQIMSNHYIGNIPNIGTYTHIYIYVCKNTQIYLKDQFVATSHPYLLNPYDI